MKILRIILISVGVTLVCAYLLVAVIFVTPMSQNKRCEELKVTVLDSVNTRFINSQDIVAMLERNHAKYMGLSGNDIDFQRIEKVLIHHPMVKFVACYQTPTGVLRVDIKQREPVFRVVTNDGGFYIDENRLEMPTSNKHAVYLPIVTGYINKAFITNELFDFIVSLQEDDFWSNQITQIHIYPNRDVELVPRVGNHIIYLGSLKNYEQKLDKLLTFYQKGLPRIGWNRYSYIDLRYRDQVVCVKAQTEVKLEN